MRRSIACGPTMRRPAAGRRPHVLTAAGALLVLAALCGPATAARVTISVDAETLTDLLSTMVQSRFSLRLTDEQSVTFELEEMKVTGFDPAAGDDGQGYILTSLRLKVPELGLNVPVKPKLSLHLEEEKGRTVCYLRFEEVEVPLPLTGAVDIASMLKRIPVPADNITTVEATRGLFNVRTRLVEARLGSRALQLAFDLEVTPLNPSGP